jgi:excinuclease ABC subunit C
MDSIDENFTIDSNLHKNIDEILENLPSLPGIYQFKNESGKVIYVGKAINLRSRVRSYFRSSSNQNPRTKALVSKIENIEIIVTDSEVEALILESNLIKSLKPRYNVLLKDDKSFPFIRITNEPFPQVFPTRRVIKDGSKYFGPYTDVKTMRSALKIIRDIFMVRNCRYYLDEDVINKRKVKLCLEYQIKKCGGPCEGLVSQSEYQTIIKNVIKLLNGRTAQLIELMTMDMQTASENLKFEEAAVLKNKIEMLTVYSQRQKVVSVESKDQDIFAFSYEDNDACSVIFKVRDGKLLEKRHYYLSNVENLSESEILSSVLETFYLESDFIPDEIFLQNEIDNFEIIKKWLDGKKGSDVSIIIPKAGEKEKLISMCKANARYLLDELKIQKMKKDDYIPHSVKALQRDLRLKKVPVRIDCFDISNTQGTDSVASMVVFVDGKPKKSEYRKFIIKTVEGPNDFASMQEVLFRRYKRAIEERLQMPDLIMVDGGKGQLSAAVEVLRGLGLESLNIIGLAKRLEEVFFPDSSDAQLLPRTSSSLKLLQNIRDEAHRFAITFHRERREKRVIDTELLKIDSVGEIKAKKLLIELGSVESVRNADFETLRKLVGEESANNIIEFYKAKP